MSSSGPNTTTLFTGEDDWDCPLCMEEMDLSDKNFRPCPCGYQVCRFCWHKIREDGNERCPACRKIYSEEDVEFTPVPQEEMIRMRQKKRAIKEKREAAAEAELDMSPAGVALTNEIINSRRHLSEFRVVQRNLVYVIGISAKIAHEHILKEPEFFGQFGKIIKIVVNKKNFLATGSNVNPPSASAYITYSRKDDAARAIELVDGSVYDDRVIRATYGTTKYCSYFLRGLGCQNPGCMYLHEPGEEVSSFTKEQLTNGNHNLQSFIVDKSESANLRQFGTILNTTSSSSSLKPTLNVQPSAHTSTQQTIPISTTPIPSVVSAVKSVPSRSGNESPRLPPPSPSPIPVPSAPPGLPPGLAPQANIAFAVERVPLINEISTSSFFDRISKMVTASELEEFASVAPRGLSFFAPKSPPPPPALSNNYGFFNLSPEMASNHRASKDEIVQPAFNRSDSFGDGSESKHGSIGSTSSSSSCPSRQSFSFSNLPIRSPRPSSSPIYSMVSGNEPTSQSSSAQSPYSQSFATNPAVPAPIKSVPIDTLFPSDYRPVPVISKPVPVPVMTSYSKPQQQPPSPTLKITIAGKPIESVSNSNSLNNFSTTNVPIILKKPTSSTPVDTPSSSFKNNNLFSLLQNAEPVEMPSPSSKKTPADSFNNPTIGPVKIVSAYALQSQSVGDLERMARENKIENHLSDMEETMFRSRMEAESLESKLKMLFEASAKRSNSASIKK